MKLPFVLFFIEGPWPSEEDKATKAAVIGAKVVFRNAIHVSNEPHSLETCDGVAGAVPEIYAKTFPKAEVAIKAYADALKALSQKVGDEPPPKKQDSEKALEAAIQRNAANPPAKPPAWNPNPSNPPA